MRDEEHIEKAFDFGGMPARNGVAAATMVAHGFTGVEDAFSGERSFFVAYGRDPKPQMLVEGLGERGRAVILERGRLHAGLSCLSVRKR